jgi:hypothetical protein
VDKETVDYWMKVRGFWREANRASKQTQERVRVVRRREKKAGRPGALQELMLGLQLGSVS